MGSIPVALRWIHYLSVFYYAFEAMLVTELVGSAFDFVAAGYATVEGVAGEVFLETLGFTLNATADIIVLVGMYGAFVLLAMLLFVWRLPRTREGKRRSWFARVLR